MSVRNLDDKVTPLGYDRLKCPELNKGTVFTESERDRYKLHGLLPTGVSCQEVQKSRALANLRRKAYDIERYVFMLALQARNERLCYRLLIDHIEELMPIIYTPTVGQAYQEFAHIFRQRVAFILPLMIAGECVNSCRTGRRWMFA
jgi:malate dehydrogenase (oxaloacetate-decarboxylating)(NADP+)